MSNKISFLIMTDGGSSSKSFNANLTHLKYLVSALFIFTVISLISFYYSHKFYQESKTFQLEKKLAVNQLTNTVKALSQDIMNNEDVDANLVRKLIKIEKNLIDMQSILRKKGIEKKLTVGGKFIPADRLSIDYINFMEEDINNLKQTLINYPIGRPSSGSVVSKYGYRKDPFNKRIAFHSGIDIDSNYGDSVIATADGVVEKAGWSDGYGKCIVIKHKNGYKTLYGHLSKIKVKRGQKIKSGDLIGNVGSTGRSTGPHLHYEVLKYDKKLNPINYVSLGK